MTELLYIAIGMLIGAALTLIRLEPSLREEDENELQRQAKTRQVDTDFDEIR
jgi:hypothetical protein